MAFSEAYWKNNVNKYIQIAIYGINATSLLHSSLIGVIYMDEVSGLLHFF